MRVRPNPNPRPTPGTPLQNNLHELWALLNFLYPELFSQSAASDPNPHPHPTPTPTPNPDPTPNAHPSPSPNRDLACTPRSAAFDDAFNLNSG